MIRSVRYCLRAPTKRNSGHFMLALQHQAVSDGEREHD